MTKEQWWNAVDRNWVNLSNILQQFLPMSEAVDYQNQPANQPMRKTVEDMKMWRDPTLVRYFNEAWWRAPDDPSIHNIPGWGLLCDLCSEYEAMDEE